MKYLLVFQFAESYFATHDELLAFGERLRNVLPRTHAFDGHDVGSGTTNFFVFTNTPLSALAAFRKYLGTNAVERKVRISYREVEGEEFFNIWPRRDPRPFALIYEDSSDPFNPASKRAIPKRSKPGVSKLVTKAGTVTPPPKKKRAAAKKKRRTLKS